MKRLPNEIAARLRERAGDLRGMLAGAETVQLIELTVALFLESEAQRWQADHYRQDLEAEIEQQRAHRRRGAAKANAGQHAITADVKRAVFEEWRAWRSEGESHPSAAKKTAGFVRWLADEDRFQAVQDPKTFEKWCGEWKGRAEEHEAFMEWFHAACRNQ